MDIVALSIQVFGIGSLVAAFVKCTMAKKKVVQVRDHTKNQLRRF